MGEFQKYVGVEKPTLPPVLPKKFTFQKSLRGKHDHEKFTFTLNNTCVKPKVYAFNCERSFSDDILPEI